MGRIGHWAIFLSLMHGTAEATTNELRLNANQPPRRFNLNATLRADTNLHRFDSVDKQSLGRLTVTPSLALGESYRTALFLTVLKDFENERRTLFANSLWTLSRKPVSLTEDTSLSPTAGVRLPTNVEDRKRNTYNGSLFIDPVVMTSWTVLGYGFQTLYGLSVVKNLHTFDRNSEGNANIDYALTHSTGLDLPLAKRLSLTFEGDYTYARTYQDSPRSFFSMTQSLSFSYQNTRWTMGHSNAGQVFQANGRDYNIRVFDENQSVVFVLLNVSGLGGIL